MGEHEYGLSERVPVMIQHNGSGPQAPHVQEMLIAFIPIKTKASRTGLNYVFCICNRTKLSVLYL